MVYKEGRRRMNLVIREYTKQDWLNFITISNDEWAQTINQLGISMMKEYDGKVLKMFLAFDDASLIGFIYGFILPNRTLIPEFMYIEPQYRHNGIAQQLLAELEKQSGCTASMIFYHKSLHGFYQKQGYETGENLEVAMKTI